MASLAAGALATVLLAGNGAVAGAVEPRTAGAQLWVNRYDGSSGADDTFGGVALTVAPNGATVYVAGETMGSTSAEDIALVAINTGTGARRWANVYNGPANANDATAGIARTPDGTTLFVAGSVRVSAGDHDLVLIAYDSATGARRWVRRYDGGSAQSDAATALTVSADGARVFVTGFSTGAGNDFDYVTVAYDVAGGGRLWASRYSNPGNALGTYPEDRYDSASAIAVSPDGGTVVVTGTSMGATTGRDYATIAYDAATGGESWKKRYDGPGSGTATYDRRIDIANAVAFSPNGARVFVTGASQNASDINDAATIAYDAAAGGRLWVARYDGSTHDDDSGSALVVSPDGTRVFIAGGTWAGSSDFLTVAYNAATGGRAWVKRDGAIGDVDFARSLAVAPDGSRLFVTGMGMNNTTGNGFYETAAYTAAGASLWKKRYDSPYLDDRAAAVAVNPNGTKVFVTGKSPGGRAEDHDITTVAYQVY